MLGPVSTEMDDWGQRSYSGQQKFIRSTQLGRLSMGRRKWVLVIRDVKVSRPACSDHIFGLGLGLIVVGLGLMKFWSQSHGRWSRGLLSCFPRVVWLWNPTDPECLTLYWRNLFSWSVMAVRCWHTDIMTAVQLNAWNILLVLILPNVGLTRHVWCQFRSLCVVVSLDSAKSCEVRFVVNSNVWQCDCIVAIMNCLAWVNDTRFNVMHYCHWPVIYANFI